MRSLLDPDQLRFAFPKDDMDLELGIRTEHVGDILSRAFSRPEVGTFAVQVPLHAGPKDMASSLEAHYPPGDERVKESE